ncbi:oxysterol-binding protein-related protein 2-like [Tropilaelaps mercedesae]|uniref:Oxysterol-binding protein-related protein 2-like n=1 Tax=Tropilaelaps mercedesae TaxID=418985 RepID=A0A1V9X3J9_9ACAR|nr:oxysterol-binding protein-related protein 2-like [Tropilaelaps mercedesae]
MYAKFNTFTRSLTVGATHNKDSSAEEDDLSHPSSRLIWESQPKPPHSAEYYHLTLFAMSLNELPDDEGDRRRLPRTDCRFRPDIRKLEEGNLERAGEEKTRLEELQRDRSKTLKKEGKAWTPLWFREHPDGSWTFSGKYWKRDFSSVPEIF